jgi:hypothetical protein
MSGSAFHTRRKAAGRTKVAQLQVLGHNREHRFAADSPVLVKEDPSTAEVGERRVRAKENIAQSNTSPTQSGELYSTTQALTCSGAVTYCALKRQAAPGVGGVTWPEYEDGLEGRISDLHSRVHRGAYWAQPWRRVYKPKADGPQRRPASVCLDADPEPCGYPKVQLLSELVQEGLPRAAHAVIDAACFRCIRMAGGEADESGTVVPRAAAEHAQGTGGRPRWIAIR